VEIGAVLANLEEMKERQGQNSFCRLRFIFFDLNGPDDLNLDFIIHMQDPVASASANNGGGDGSVLAEREADRP
jgi:hypothetical protein